jgi:hypothetical protein
MKRLTNLLAVGCFGLSLITAGCRSNLAGPPSTAGAPAFEAAGVRYGATSTNPLTAERTMLPFTRIGSSNTITAEPPIPRPDTKPCVVTLFARKVFKNFSDKTFSYTPPADCPGPWAKVVFNFDVRVTKGIQYDRTAILWVDGAVIYFGTTSEPSPNLAPHWRVARDVTDVSALFKQSSTGQVQLWNCYCPPDYTGYQIAKAWLQFYPPDAKFSAPRVADQVIGLPYDPPDGNVATLPHSPMEYQGTLPTNIERAYADVFLQSQNDEEQWFMCVPDEVWYRTDKGLGFCRDSAFREGLVTVNGKPAGISPIYPWIYTGGMDPYLWFPMPGVQTLNFVPFRIDLTPFAGELSNGSTQTVDVSVFRAFNYFSGAGDLLLYLDPKQSTVTGGVTEDTLPPRPVLIVSNHLSYGSGTGLFGGTPAMGTVDTRSRTDYTISGYVNTSSGNVTTTIKGSSHFVNEASFDYTANKYVQLVIQNTHFDTTTTTQAGAQQTTVTNSFFYPLTVSYPFLPITSGWKNPVKVYQGYQADTTDTGGRTISTETSNTVESGNTLLYNASFEPVGERNSTSVQLYTLTSKHPTVCYGKEIDSKQNVVTAITKPGCTATPPPRRPPGT